MANPRRTTTTLASLEASHAASGNPGSVRSNARRLAKKLREPCPDWALPRSRSENGKFVPIRPAPSVAPLATSVGDQLAALDLLRDWRRVGNGQRVLVARHDGSVTLIDYTEFAEANFADALEACEAVELDIVEWIAIKRRA